MIVGNFKKTSADTRIFKASKFVDTKLKKAVMCAKRKSKKMRY